VQQASVNFCASGLRWGEALATKADVLELKTELKTEIAELRSEFVEFRADTKVAIAELRAGLLKWNVGAMATLTVIYSGINAALRFLGP
jgi:hypothetical protein